MRLALIPPTNYLFEFACYRENSYHMALAQRALEDKKYANFYAQRSLAGDYVILDNGACELKTSIGFNRLIEAIKSLNPHVVVLPDRLGDTKTTIQLSIEFLNLNKDHLGNNVIFMGVVQGQTKKEWFDCFNYFYSHKDVDLIGISNTEAVFKSSPTVLGRTKTLKYLSEKGMLNQGKKIHLLGLPDSGHLELKEIKNIPNIEGVDTSAPIVHGAGGILFEMNKPYKKIRHYLDQNATLNEVQINNIKHNIDILVDAIG